MCIKEVKNVSDFFYREKLGPVFSPVISVKKEKLSPAVVSALDNLLSPSGNMFTRAETIKVLMHVEKLSLEQTAKTLSLRLCDVADKLRLLEFSDRERAAVLEYGFSEGSALEFLKLDKVSRLYTMEYCRKNGFDDTEIARYVSKTLDAKSARLEEASRKKESLKKFVVNDVGFFFNSIENALRLARSAGFIVENKRSESKDCYDIHITVKKKNGDG